MTGPLLPGLETKMKMFDQLLGATSGYNDGPSLLNGAGWTLSAISTLLKQIDTLMGQLQDSPYQEDRDAASSWDFSNIMSEFDKEQGSYPSLSTSMNESNLLDLANDIILQNQNGDPLDKKFKQFINDHQPKALS